MQKKSFNIPTRLNIAVSICVVFIISCLLFFIWNRGSYSVQRAADISDQSIENISQQHLIASLQAQSFEISKYFNDSLLNLQGVASTIQTIHSLSNTSENLNKHLKTTITETLYQHLASHKDIAGVYIAYREDVFSQHPEPLGTNSNGRFAFSLSYGIDELIEEMIFTEDLILDTESGPSGQPANHWYQCSLAGKPCLIEPYEAVDSDDGAKALFSSLSLPITHDGKVIGVLGIDFNLSHLQDILNTSVHNLAQGISDLTLLTDSGILVAENALARARTHARTHARMLSLDLRPLKKAPQQALKQIFF